MFIVGLFYCFGAAQKRAAGEVRLNCIGLELVLLEQINKFRFFGNDLVLSYADVILLGASQIPIDTYSQHADEGKNAHQDTEKTL